MLAVLGAGLLLGACQYAVLDPAGDVARQQRDIIYISTGLMLLIIVPVLILIVVFAWRYRKGKGGTYDPEFDHSTSLELIIWSAPLLIIIALGALTWSSTHLLDPFRPLDRIEAAQGADAPMEKPMPIQVVSMDWKWLFIYPELGIATVNELVLPVNRQVRFDITSTNMMNTFYAPTLAGMIYAMPGMQSQLHAVLNRPGEYSGMSANYSGAGFSDMTFKLRGVDDAGFARWVARGQGLGPCARPRHLPAAGAPERKGPADPLRGDRQRPLSPDPRALRRAGHAVPVADHGAGHGRGGPYAAARKLDAAARQARRRADEVAGGERRGPQQQSLRSRRAPSSPRPSPRRRARTATCPRSTLEANPPVSDFSKILFGRLTWESFPIHEPILIGTFAVVALLGLGIVGAVTKYKLWGWLWREWFTTVDHKKIGIMYMILGIIMLLRGFADALMMRLQQSMAFGGERGLPQRPPLRPDLHRARDDHDLLRRDSLDRGGDQLRHAAADRGARRRLPLSQQPRLLADCRGRACW